MSEKTLSRARWLVFPAVIVATIATAVGLLPHLGAPLTLIVCQLGALIVVAGCERWLPYIPDWNRSHGDVRTDLLHALVSGIGTTQLVWQFAQAAGVMIAGVLSGAFGTHLWPVSWPYGMQLALALVIVEFPQYWLHRWQHEHELLWRFHAVHHSAPRLYWLNAGRFHPIDIGLLYILGYVPLVVLGCPVETIMLFTLFDAVFGMMQHCNIDVRLGPLNYLFSMAEPHRWHHSRTLSEANTNYGSNLILWDLAFGTFFLPSGRQPPAQIGIAGVSSFPTEYLGQLASPFRWRSITAQSKKGVSC